MPTDEGLKITTVADVIKAVSEAIDALPARFSLEIAEAVIEQPDLVECGMPALTIEGVGSVSVSGELNPGRLIAEAFAKLSNDAVLIKITMHGDRKPVESEISMRRNNGPAILTGISQLPASVAQNAG